MSLFALVACKKAEISTTHKCVIETAGRLHPEIRNTVPVVFEGHWGMAFIWPGPKDAFLRHSQDDTGNFSASLGWNPHTSLLPALLNRPHVTVAAHDESPIGNPELSLGIYALIHGGRHGAICVPDPYGFYPVYVSRGPSPRTFSNCQLLASALNGEKPSVDENAVIERLVTEGNLGSRCLLSNIRRLLPAEWISMDSGGASIHSYKIPQVTISKDDYLGILANSVEAARKLGRPIVLKLTGGRDSRLNLAVMIKSLARPLCFTKKSIDSPSAKFLAQKHDLLHVDVDAASGEIVGDAESVAEYEKVEAKAVYVTGGCGELARAFYLKEAGSLLQNIKMAIDHVYLSTKRRALVDGDKIAILQRLLNLRYAEAQANEPSGCEPVDALYVDRIRSWYSEAWASPIGSNNIPLLVGPATYAYARNYTLNQRAQGQPHDDLISDVLGEIDPPYLKPAYGVAARIEQALPFGAQVNLRRLMGYLSARTGNLSAQAAAHGDYLRGVLSDREIRLLARFKFSQLKDVGGFMMKAKALT